MTFQGNKVFRLIFLFLLVCFIPAFLYGSTTDTIKLFYGINQYELSNFNKLKLSHLKRKILKHPSKISVLGYADYLGDTASNLKLSYKRVNEVKGYLSGLIINADIAAKGEGEVAYPYKKSGSGNAADRKVEVIIETGQTDNPKGISQIVDTSSRIITAKTNGKNGKTNNESPFQSKIDSLSALSVGGSVTVKELVFFPGRHVLMPRSFPYLDSLTAYFKEHKNLIFKIVGHVCCDFDSRDGYDLDGRRYDLSTERARFICGYLVKNGIDRNRMKYIGLGTTAPKVFPEKTPKDEEINRRVEIVIEGK